jgi:hypothetical protein
MFEFVVNISRLYELVTFMFGGQIDIGVVWLGGLGASQTYAMQLFHVWMAT